MTFQPAAALPVDADEWWFIYLRGQFVDREESYAQNVFFSNEVPNPRKDRMVIIRRDGGSVTGLFDQPRVALDVWAKTKSDVINLSRLVIALALKAPLAGAGVTHVRHLSGPNLVEDPSKQPRRLSLIEATHRVALLAD
jgi:hypothetical protein